MGNCPVSRNQAGKNMDSVGDLLIRIKNGYMARRGEVTASYSKLNLAILKLLTEERYITSFEVLEDGIKVILKYESKKPALTDVKRISKPSRRVYMGSKRLPIVYDGLGIAIISTPKGVMSGRKARKEGVGGEVMAYVW